MMDNKMEVEDPKQPQIEYGTKVDSSGRTCKVVLVVIVFLAMAACIIGLAVALANKNKEEMAPAPTTQKPTDDADRAPRSRFGKYRYAAVAADSETCSNMGSEMLTRGSTVDATITTMVCICVLHPHSCGIGGGFLATIYDSKTKKARALISREVAPIAATEDMYVNDTSLSSEGGLSIAVPGDLAGYGALHEQYGRLPWAVLFQPIIKLCEEGHIVDKALSIVIEGKKDLIMSKPMLKDLFVKPDGQLYKEGDTLKRPLLAKTFKQIAAGGANAYYNGSLAADIAADVQDNGGIITTADLAAYRPAWKDPVSVTLSHGDYTLYGPPPPSSSAVLYYILNVVNGYMLKPSDRNSVQKKILLAHRLIEAMKFGYGKRSYLGDEDFVNVTEWKEKLSSDSFAEEARKKIKDDTVLKFEEYDSSFVLPNDGGTAHFSIFGPDGMAVSITATVNHHLGSKVRGSRTGIIFDNEMDDFSTRGLVNYYGFAPSETNFIVPGKRPMSSMSPTIAVDKDGKVVAILGASGGTRIITAVIHTLVNSLWLGYNATDSMDQPRYHHQLLPDQVLHEPSLPKAIVDGLAKKGHKKFAIRGYPQEFSVVQFVRSYCNENPSDKYCLVAVSDMRRGGIPDGL